MPKENKTAIIPLYITHSGCPHLCIYCNQKIASDHEEPIKPQDIKIKIEKALALVDRTKYNQVEIAFYGGSFTALDIKEQEALLLPIQEFILSGQVDSIRVSTRPDYINEEVLSLLKSMNVKTIEIGAQSMNDEVLKLAKRGHSSADIINASRLIKKIGFMLSIHLMIGLPVDTPEISINSAKSVIELQPDFVRIHPTLVLKGTQLEEEYQAGRFKSWDSEQVLNTLKEMLKLFEEASIKVIRIGLQPSEGLLLKENVISGFNHPSMRELCESLIFLDEMTEMIDSSEGKDIVFLINPSDISKVLGHKRFNFIKLTEQYPNHEICYETDMKIPKGEIGLK